MAPVLRPDGDVEDATHRRVAGPPDDLLRGIEGPFVRLTDALVDLKILGSVGSDRMRLRVQRLLARTVGLLVAGVIALVLVVAGTVFLASGFAGGLRALFTDRPWLGEIVAGLTILAAVVLLWFAARANAERATTSRLENKYAEMERKRSRATPSPDAGGSAGSGGRACARPPAE